MANINRIPELVAEMKELSQLNLVVGVPVDDEFLQMIARVNENGLTLRAKHNYLTIPTAAADGRKAKDVPGLFRPKGKMVLAVADKSSHNGIKVMFVLKESVRIPPRPFIRFTYNHCRDDWQSLMRRQVGLLMDGKATARSVMNALGRQISNDIKRTIKQMQSPRNAPLTVARKGFDDPLIDTGKLIGSITWKIERKS
ncbi:hypothetical protein [Lactobacillus brevis] [Lactiplantibacillus mudanjiangensis]|uniref:hypothetical protein n=1 Tax=Lactiplantibacillus mudanjiangensis TaxID=1296538 RepID=UPI00101474EB|nr:hypothetical protein [Lactiplantibacillus mudanjiangensis]VDG32878.1 hypothetical protein [Lactobacillus brevis] [Lactiplantibacillus mudanjiangensis]